MNKFQEIINELRKEYNENNLKIKKLEKQISSYLFTKEEIKKTVECEIELEQLKNKNNILIEAINDLKLYKSSMIYQLNKNRPHEILSFSDSLEKIEDSIERKSEKLNEIQQELETLNIKSTLIKRFDNVRNIKKRILRVLEVLVDGTIISALFINIPLLLVAGILPIQTVSLGIILIILMELLEVKKFNNEIAVLEMFNKELEDDSISYISDYNNDNEILEKTEQLQEEVKYNYISKLKYEFEKIKIEKTLKNIENLEQHNTYTNDDLLKEEKNKGIKRALRLVLKK